MTNHETRSAFPAHATHTARRDRVDVAMPRVVPRAVFHQPVFTPGEKPAQLSQMRLQMRRYIK